jgi:hypothetical protein
MPRTARAIEAGMVYHVLNRGNGRIRIFHKVGDYEVPVAESPFCHPERSEGSQKGQILRFAQNDN